MLKKLKMDDAAVEKLEEDVEWQEDESFFVGHNVLANKEDKSAEDIFYTAKIGDNSGQPNANGDIIDWSNHDPQTYSDSGVIITTTGTTTPIGGSTTLTTGGYSIGVGSCGTSPYIFTNPSSSTISIQTNQDKYAILELPREDESPTSVFVCGRMVTLGVIGADVECAFLGNKLIFEPGIVNFISYQGRITVSVEYKDAIYHYNVGSGGSVHFVNEGTLLDSNLASTIEK